MKIEEVTMTPALAATLLERNTKNRLVNPRRVNTIAHAIASGHYLHDGNPFKIDENGVLLDGQHRLNAVLQSGESIPAILITGLPASSRMTIDTNRPRSFADYLRMEQVANSSDIAAVTRLLWNYERGDFRTATGWSSMSLATTLDLWGLYQERGDEIRESVSAARHLIAQLRILRSAAALAWMIFVRIDAADADDFFAQLALDKPQGSPALALFRMLNNTERRGRSGMYEQQLHLALVIKAWNAYRSGREVKTLTWRRGGAQRENFPEPE